MISVCLLLLEVIVNTNISKVVTLIQKSNGTVEKETPPKIIELPVDTHFSYYTSDIYGYTT